MVDVTRHQHNGLKGELVRLLGQLPCDGPDPQLGGCPCRRYGICRLVDKLDYCAVQALADHLIANGAVIQRWIPVTERKPDVVACNAGTAYSEAVNVVTSGSKVLTAIWDGSDFIADAEFWDAENEEITHWAPVLLPLPQLPKDDAHDG